MLTPSFVCAYWMRGSMAQTLYAIAPFLRSRFVDRRKRARYREV
jgi:hypothetical protein